MTVRLDELTWPEVREVLKRPNLVIVPVGATEEHGGHLPLNVDSVEATYVAETAAKIAGAKRSAAYILVAPTLHYTDVSIHKMFPGTIGIGVETLIHTIEDITRSFLEQKFQNILYFIAHREDNCSIEAAVRKVNSDFPEAGLYVISMVGLGGAMREGICKAGKSGVGHALESETSQTMLMQPQNVKMDKVIKGSRELPLSENFIGFTGKDQSKGIIYYPAAFLKGAEESGVLGDPTQASREEGQFIVNTVAGELADIVIQILDKK